MEYVNLDSAQFITMKNFYVQFNESQLEFRIASCSNGLITTDIAGGPLASMQIQVDVDFYDENLRGKWFFDPDIPAWIFVIRVVYETARHTLRGKPSADTVVYVQQESIDNRQNLMASKNFFERLREEPGFFDIAYNHYLEYKFTEYGTLNFHFQSGLVVDEHQNPPADYVSLFPRAAFSKGPFHPGANDQLIDKHWKQLKLTSYEHQAIDHQVNVNVFPKYKKDIVHKMLEKHQISLEDLLRKLISTDTLRFNDHLQSFHSAIIEDLKKPETKRDVERVIQDYVNCNWTTYTELFNVYKLFICDRHNPVLILDSEIFIDKLIESYLK
jgi:hypothetical protein